VRTFLSRYLASLTNAPRQGGDLGPPGRPRYGYSFGERYWASLTRTRLPPLSAQLAATPVRDDARPAGTGTVTLARNGGASGSHRANATRSGSYRPELGWQRLDRGPRRQHKRRNEIFAIGGALASAFFAIGLALATNPAASPSAAVSQQASASPAPTNAILPGGAAISAQIVFPYNGAIEFAGQQIPAYGTIQSAQPHHQLALFVEYAGTSGFYIANAHVTVQGGNWQAAITVVEPGSITLWLVDLAPDAIQALYEETGDQMQGFVTTLKFSSGATPLANVAFTAYGV
jgi:hypothetical protein